MDIKDRVLVLEIQLGQTKIELKQAEEKIEELEQKISYYDKMALKWGGACMGILVFGAMVGGQFDKIKEKIIGWFL